MSRLIMEQQQTAAFERYGAFFAFSDKQLEEKRQEGIKYVSLFSGLIAPKDNAKRLLEELEAITDNYIKRDIKENGKTAIIERELANHEAGYTYSIDDTVTALESHGITTAEVQAVFNNWIKENSDEVVFNNWIKENNWKPMRR